MFCVLTQFHARLKRRDIYAETSTRWRDPRAQLLDGEAWTAAKGTVLTALGLPEDPDALLAAHARLLDDTYRGVAGRFAVNDAVSVDADGRLHVERIKAIPEPGSLIDLRKRVSAMLPRVDLPEVLLEVMGWEPGFAGAFTSVSGSRSRLADLDITIAACLTAHALNIGYGPVVKKGVPALERDRVGHVGLNYLRPETYSRANAPLIDRQGSIPLARAWGGGLVASVDGMRFVVPVPTIYARPNRKFFGPKRGITWLNMINDQAAGLGAKVVSGTPRDSLHMIDVLYARDGGQRPDIVITDSGSYSDLVCPGLCQQVIGDLPGHPEPEGADCRPFGEPAGPAADAGLAGQPGAQRIGRVGFDADREGDACVEVQGGPDSRQRGDQPEPGLLRDADPAGPHFGRGRGGQDRPVLAAGDITRDRSAATAGLAVRAGDMPLRRGASAVDAPVARSTSFTATRG